MLCMSSSVEGLRVQHHMIIEDRIATLEQDLKEMSDIEIWFQEHQGRYSVLVAESKGEIVGWASLNPYSHRCAYQGVADLSVYVDRACRGPLSNQGVFYL